MLLSKRTSIKQHAQSFCRNLWLVGPHNIFPSMQSNRVVKKYSTIVIIGALLATSMVSRGVDAKDNIPATKTGPERLLVRVEVNGQPLRFALDTGAQAHVLFRPVAERLQLKVAYPPAGQQVRPGYTKAGKSEPCRISLFGQTATASFAVVDVPLHVANEVDGVLSLNNISAEHLVRLNAEEARLAIPETLPDDIAQYARFRLRADKLLVFELPGTPNPAGAVLVDTGSAEGIELSAEWWDQWQKNHPDQPATLVALGQLHKSEPLVSPVYWADRFAIGELTVSNVPLPRADSDVEYAVNGHKATLGLFALKRLDVIIDRKGDSIYLRPNSGSKSSYEHNRLGAVFVPRDAKEAALIAHVAKDSPAAGAGIRSGDVLLKVGALDVTKWQTDPQVMPLSRFWGQPVGTDLKLLLERDGKRFEVKVTLRNILGS